MDEGIDRPVGRGRTGRWSDGGYIGPWKDRKIDGGRMGRWRWMCGDWAEEGVSE